MYFLFLSLITLHKKTTWKFYNHPEHINNLKPGSCYLLCLHCLVNSINSRKNFFFCFTHFALGARRRRESQVCCFWWIDEAPKSKREELLVLQLRYSSGLSICAGLTCQKNSITLNSALNFCYLFSVFCELLKLMTMIMEAHKEYETGNRHYAHVDCPGHADCQSRLFKLDFHWREGKFLIIWCT